VTCAGAVPKAGIAALPGARDVEVRGQQAAFRLAGELDALTAFLAQHQVTDLAIERASLDELFRSFYEDPRGA
jgi:hypothetical protein